MERVGKSEEQQVAGEGITCSLNSSFKKFIWLMSHKTIQDSDGYSELRIGRNNWIGLVDLPRSVYNPIERKRNKEFFSSKPIGRCSRRGIIINDLILACPENAIGCSEMVEVVE